MGEAEKKNLDLLVIVPDRAVTLNTDQRSLTQILLNLPRAMQSGSRNLAKCALCSLGRARDGERSSSACTTRVLAEDPGKLYRPFTRRKVATARKGTELGFEWTENLDRF